MRAGSQVFSFSHEPEPRTIIYVVGTPLNMPRTVIYVVGTLALRLGCEEYLLCTLPPAANCNVSEIYPKVSTLNLYLGCLAACKFPITSLLEDDNFDWFCLRNEVLVIRL